MLWVHLDVISLPYLNSGSDMTVLETGSWETLREWISNDWRGAISRWLYHITRTEGFVLCWACFIRVCKQLIEDNMIFICLQPSVLNNTCVHPMSINSLKFSETISSQISWVLYTTHLKTVVSLYSSDSEEWAMLNRRMLLHSVKY